MVFPSVTPFLEHHMNNWHQQLQQSNQQLGNNDGGGENPNFQSQLVPAQRDGEGSVRPGSMVDRARQARIPMPEPGLNCPRCDSTNTKFCYFNNYSLTQPRHFCKTCRRYWTRGGALRNVPVGGGYRRNKRSNKNSRRSTSPSQRGTKSISGSPSRCSNENMASSTQLSHPPSLQMPFMGSYGGVAASNITSSLGGFLHQSNQMGSFQLGTGGTNGNNFSNILSIGNGESWRLPFLEGFEVPNNTNLFIYQSEGAIDAPTSSVLENSHVNPPVIKVEGNQDLNLSRQISGLSENTDHQPWQVGNTWAEISGVNASSSTPTTHFI